MADLQRRRIGDLRPHRLAERSPATTPKLAPSGPPPSSVVAWGWYVEGVRQPCDDLDVATQAAIDGRGFVWLGLHDPSDADMAEFATLFNLHPLAIEDAVEGHNRSKLELFGDTVFAVASTVAYVEHTKLTETSEVVSTGQVMVFVGEHFVMTVRRGEQAQLGGLRARLESDPESLADGPWTVLYSVLDKIVDDYVDVVAAFEEDVDDVESEVFSLQTSNNTAKVYHLKRELIDFKRATLPLSAPLHALANRAFAPIPHRAQAYFREVADHHVEARETITSLDEVLTSILQFAQARLSVKDNQDMRKISAFVAIAAIPTMVAGIYGMNFENMPELHWRYSYFVVLGVLIITMIALYVGFRRNKWL